jgi:secondary thiamine-phosphate synthase enzyme
MAVITGTISRKTGGFNDIQDITADVADIVGESGLSDGIVTLFVTGSTGGVTTIEFEPGLVKDIPEALDRIAPMGKTYHHDAAWGDGNGFSHVRAALLGPSLTVPFSGGSLLLGTWQQIVLIDFDNKARTRKIAVQVLGEQEPGAAPV